MSPGNLENHGRWHKKNGRRTEQENGYQFKMPDTACQKLSIKFCTSRTAGREFAERRYKDVEETANAVEDHELYHATGDKRTYIRYFIKKTIGYNH
jgi:hypothetical protein